MPLDRTITFEQKGTTPPLIRRGAIYNFYFNASGTGASALTGTFSVVRYINDSALITGNLTYTKGRYKGTLTGANTASLTAGVQYFIYAEFTDADEDIHIPVKIYIAEGRG